MCHVGVAEITQDRSISSSGSVWIELSLSSGSGSSMSGSGVRKAGRSLSRLLWLLRLLWLRWRLLSLLLSSRCLVGVAIHIGVRVSVGVGVVGVRIGSTAIAATGTPCIVVRNVASSLRKSLALRAARTVRAVDATMIATTVRAACDSSCALAPSVPILAAAKAWVGEEARLGAATTSAATTATLTATTATAAASISTRRAWQSVQPKCSESCRALIGGQLVNGSLEGLHCRHTGGELGTCLSHYVLEVIVEGPMILTPGHLTDRRVALWQCILEHGDEQSVIWATAPSPNDVVACNLHVVELMAQIILAHIVAGADVRGLQALQSGRAIVHIVGIVVTAQKGKCCDAITRTAVGERGPQPAWHRHANDTIKPRVVLVPSSQLRGVLSQVHSVGVHLVLVELHGFIIQTPLASPSTLRWRWWPDGSIGWLGSRLGALKDAKDVRLLPSDPDRQIGEEGGEGEARAVERRRLTRVLIAARCVNKVRQA